MDKKKQLSAGAAALLVMLWSVSMLIMQLVSQLAAPFLSESWMKYVWTGVVELTFILIPLCIVNRANQVRGLPGIHWVRGEGKAVALAAGIALVAYPVMLIFQNVWILFLEGMGAVPEQTIMPDIHGLSGLVLAIVSVAACAAFAEEIAMRGVLMPSLRRRMGDKAALLITATVFCIMHGSFSALPYTFIFGALLCWLALRTRSLWPSMMFHFVNNTIATVLSYMSQGEAVQQAAAQMTAEIRWMSILSLGFAAVPASALLAVMLYFYRRVTPGALMPEKEADQSLWWLPLAAGAAAFATMVLNSAMNEFGGGAACVLMWFA